MLKKGKWLYQKPLEPVRGRWRLEKRVLPMGVLWLTESASLCG